MVSTKVIGNLSGYLLGFTDGNMKDKCTLPNHLSNKETWGIPRKIDQYLTKERYPKSSNSCLGYSLAGQMSLSVQWGIPRWSDQIGILWKGKRRVNKWMKRGNISQVAGYQLNNTHHHHHYSSSSTGGGTRQRPSKDSNPNAPAFLL